MQRIEKTDPATASPEASELLGKVKSQMGMVPNILATMARAPAALEGYLGLSSALGKGKLSAKWREQIALTVAGENACDYCASVHTAVGGQLGLAANELRANLRGQSEDSKVMEALTFARRIVEDRGFVNNTDLTLVRAAGYSDEEIVEIIANVMVNIFTNYFNHIAGTEIDFPVVDSRSKVAA